MRLWSIHPYYLDAKGLVALWREGLLAQKVLLGETKGYRNHPQLHRFRASSNPVGSIASYLRCIADEAETRGYNFDRSKIARRNIKKSMPVTSGQIEYEFGHLLRKLKARDPGRHAALKANKSIRPHPLFRKVKGNVEQWEVI